MTMNLQEIKELSKRFTPEQIEGCITQQLETGQNICLRDESSEKIVSELAKAKFVRDMMERGMSLPDALRELARRMRQVQSFAERKE